jgi:hypothetical protein
VTPANLTYYVRILPTSGSGPSREETYPTKRAALDAIERMGKLAFIQKAAPRTWVVRQKGGK